MAEALQTVLDFLVTGQSKAVLGTFRLDVSLQETHSMDAEVTDNPVEDGTLVSDHIILKPQALNIEGLVTETPIRFLSGIRDALSDSGVPRVQTADQKMQELYKTREPFDVMTGLREYKNMVLTSYVVNRAPARGMSLRFTATMREIKFANIVVVEIPPNILSLAKQNNTSTVAKGTGTTKTVPQGSTLSRTIDSVKALFGG